MITEHNFTEIFCIADDFCKVFDTQMAKYSFKAERKRKYHRQSRMSKAEIMVIMILFHSSYTESSSAEAQRPCPAKYHLPTTAYSFSTSSPNSRARCSNSRASPSKTAPPGAPPTDPQKKKF